MATQLNVPFNETQLYLLSLFEHNRTQTQLSKLKMAVSKFYFDEVEREVKRACKEKKLTAAKINAFAAKNHHTPYR